jgi:uncharacterized protein (DUF169 family)
MTDLSQQALRLKTLLNINLEPVGVAFFKHGREVPPGLEKFTPDQGLKSYCQGLTRAARGETFLTPREKLGCVLGTSVLGLEEDPAPLLEDSVREKHGAGLYETEQAGRASVDGAPKFPAGSVDRVLIGPLGSLPVPPQLVVMETDPETTMWLLYAANYQQGGTQHLPQSGGVAGGCADITVLPMTNGETNLTFLGLGCRIKSGIPPQHLMLGFPFHKIDEITGHLEKMAKPIAKLAQTHT